MPRRASRILLEISELYVERLKDISYEDAKAEGVAPFQPPYLDDSYTFVEDYRGGFIKLWESINGQGSFGLNPCVWVIEFKRVTP